MIPENFPPKVKIPPFFLEDSWQIQKESGYLMSLPKKGHHEMISTWLEASSMQRWDALHKEVLQPALGNARKQRSCWGWHSTEHNTWTHAGSSCSRNNNSTAKLSSISKDAPRMLVLVWSYTQCLCLSQHTLCTLNTHTASWLICPVLTEPSLLLSFEGYGSFL